jgi:ribonuclease R
VTFTIDGIHSKDYDDAISARVESSDNIRVWVHVADVTAYLAPDTALDREARRRATSLYLPTQTVPMLPPHLSNGLCSLVPGEDRLAVTCEMLLCHGDVLDYSIYRSHIRSDARLTYDHVDQIFLGHIEPGLTYAAALAAAREASRVDQYPEDDYGLEPEFKIEKGEVVSVHYPDRGKAHRLIERLMILANETVARHMRDSCGLGLYRIHAGASELKKALAVSKLQGMGLDGETYEQLALEADRIAREDQGDWNDQQVRTILNLVRNISVAAEYTTEIARHEGLNTEAYTHFTSPIRRYADVLVHRIILGTLKDRAAVDGVLDHINEETMGAKRLERKANDICHVSRYATSHKIGDVLNDLPVTGISARGLYIKLSDETDGYLPIYDGELEPESGVCHLGDMTITLGDSVRAKIQSIDIVSGRIRLKLAA